MTTIPSLLADGKKFFWDGRHYDNEPQARAAADVYEHEGFEVRVVMTQGSARVYTRRLATPPVSAHE